MIGLLLLACLWDQDTLAMEKRQFPDTLQVLAGEFTRHSKEFYEWRIRDRRKKLKTDPGNLRLLDDLAVAYDKTGRPEKGIELMRASLARKPGRYETVANLGTLLIHAGRLEEGLARIREAIRINPDAHFGREIVQAWVVEYVLARRRAGAEGFPLRPKGTARKPHGGFAAFLRDKGVDITMDRAKIVKGLTGMMFFGNHTSPVLCECLGDVLVRADRYEREGARRTAARAYLKASYAMKDEAARAQYRRFANRALQSQTTTRRSKKQITLERVESTFAKERKRGAAYAASIAADEQRWIDEGADVDARFRAKYYRNDLG
ncbi:MAG: hypothetical protein AAGD14_10715 [Planctomycetota bacterium]